MKFFKTLFPFLLICFLEPVATLAQDQEDTVDYRRSKVYVVIKNDGTKFVGNIISRDAREVVIEDNERGKVVIPKHEIKEIKEVEEGELDKDGEYISESPFGTTYFIFPNGIPLGEGESHFQRNWYGPDFQFRIGDRFGAGLSTSWLGIPIVANAKYSIDLGESADLGVATFLGTGSWASANSFLAVPMTLLTFGDKRSNFTMGAGYGTIQGRNIDNDLRGGRIFLNAGGLARIGDKVSLVMEADYFPPRKADNLGIGLVIPGIRWNQGPEKAFQIGFAGIFTEETIIPFPLPFLRWHRTL